MDPLETQIKPVSLATAMGGENVSVTCRDGSVGQVFVYALPVSEIGRWAELDSRCDFASEVELVEALYCRKPSGWADGLSPESYEAVLAKGEELNRPIYARVRSRADQRARDWSGVANSQAQLAADLGVKLSVMPSPESASPATSHPPTP